MKTAEMKKVLVQKLKDEGTCFTAKDVSVKKAGKVCWINIKGYEHIPFKISFEIDEYFGYIVWVSRYWRDTETGKKEFDNVVSMVEDRHGHDWRQAMLELGYHIGTRF